MWFQDVLDCEKSTVSGMGKAENPLCHVVSDTSGKFTFPCLVTGDYFLVCYYTLLLDTVMDSTVIYLSNNKYSWVLFCWIYHGLELRCKVNLNRCSGKLPKLPMFVDFKKAENGLYCCTCALKGSSKMLKWITNEDLCFLYCNKLWN